MNETKLIGRCALAPKKNHTTGYTQTFPGVTTGVLLLLLRTSVSVLDDLDVPSECLKPLGDIFGEGKIGVAINRYFVRVVKGDEVAKAPMASKGACLVGHALHHAAIASNSVPGTKSRYNYRCIALQADYLLQLQYLARDTVRLAWIKSMRMLGCYGGTAVGSLYPGTLHGVI